MPGRVGVAHGVVHARAGRLAHRHQVVAAQHLAVHLLQELVDARPVHEVRIAGGQRRAGNRLAFRVALVFGNQVDDVHSEAVDALVAPEAHQVVDLGAQFGVFPVEVRLLDAEQVQVILAGRLVELPYRAAEERLPVRGHVPVHRRLPEVVVALVGLRILAGFHEPGVLVRGVVDHQVEHDLQPALVRLCQQFVEVGHRAELGHDGAVIRDVVAVVVVGRGEDGREPDHVHAQPRQIIEPRDHAAQIAHAVAVRVLEAARVNLVDHRILKPGSAGRGERGRRHGGYHTTWCVVGLSAAGTC